MNGSTVLPGIIAGALIQRLKIWPGGNLKGPHCRPGRSFRPVSRMSKGNRTMNASAVTRISRFIVAGLLMYHSAAATGAAQPPYTLEQVMDYAFPSELVASPVGSAVAWAVVLRGARNIWFAEGPDFRPRRLTEYGGDDGQELTNLTFSGDGRHVIYVRG